MANGVKHKEMITQFERAGTPGEQMECLFCMTKAVSSDITKLERVALPKMWLAVKVLIFLEVVNLLLPNTVGILGGLKLAAKAMGIGV